MMTPLMFVCAGSQVHHGGAPPNRTGLRQRPARVHRGTSQLSSTTNSKRQTLPSADLAAESTAFGLKQCHTLTT